MQTEDRLTASLIDIVETRLAGLEVMRLIREAVKICEPVIWCAQ
jgi:hypothetical protein